jgi:hypothetical protein
VHQAAVVLQMFTQVVLAHKVLMVQQVQAVQQAAAAEVVLLEVQLAQLLEARAVQVQLQP